MALSRAREGPSMKPVNANQTIHQADVPAWFERPVTHLDRVIEWLLVGLFIFMPMALGARSAWSEQVVILVTSVMGLLFLIKMMIDANAHWVSSWIYVPITMFVLICVCQTIPWPDAWIRMISPHTYALKAGLATLLPQSDQHVTPASMRLTLYAFSTEHDLRLILAVVTVFVVVLNTFRRIEQVKRLLLSIALIGGSIAFVALLQDLVGNGKIFWCVSSPHGTAYAGPFYNHSHYGQFMNLSMGAALGYVCVRLYEDFHHRELNVSDLSLYFKSSQFKSLGMMIAMMAMAAVTVFVSLTRGGMVSIVVATTVTTLLLARRHSFRGMSWVIVVLILVTFAGLLNVGFDAVVNRLTTLSEVDSYDCRMQILKDLTACYKRFPVFGTGLGTHAVVYPMFQTVQSTALFTHAENEYAQLMEETGLVGVGLVFWFAGIVVYRFVTTLKKQARSIQAAIYGLGFGLMAIGVHSLSDFGQHVPANACLTATFCALVLVLSRSGYLESSERSKVSPICFRLSMAIVLLGMGGAYAWSITGANHYRLAESKWAKALALEEALQEENWQGSDETYSEIVNQARLAHHYEPGNIEYRYWLNVYQWYQVSRNEDLIHGFLPDSSMAVVSSIVDSLFQGCRDCPTFGTTYSTLGQIKKLVYYEDEEGGALIRQGWQLDPQNPMLCLVAGCLDLEEGEVDASLDKFIPAVNLKASLFKGIVDIYVQGAHRPDLAVKLAQDNIGRLSHVANVLVKLDGYEEIVTEAQSQLVSLLETQCAQANAPASALISLADVYRKRDDLDHAIDLYYQALVLEYGQVTWRLNLARLLAETGQIQKAINEARICLKLRPQFKAAEKLIGELSIHPDLIQQQMTPAN